MNFLINLSCDIHESIGYNVDVMRRSACLVDALRTVNNFAVLFHCIPVGRGSDSIITPHKDNYLLVGAGHLSVSWPTVSLLLFKCFSSVADAQGISRCFNAL